MGIGDVVSQAAFEDKGIKDIDKCRVIRFAGIGLIFIVSVKMSHTRARAHTHTHKE
jgi:hypothetical protein